MDAADASRLCNACGLCCNGVLFHHVRLLPGDDPQALVQASLRLKRKKTGTHLLQPCPAHRDSCCAIYATRPQRCRLFACRQLRAVAAGAIPESAALEKIRDVKERVRMITGMLDAAGRTDLKRPLSKRCEKILAEPAFEPELVALHENIAREFAALDAILDADFRVSDFETSSESRSE